MSTITDSINNEMIARIWAAHGLGAARAVVRCGRGGINPCFTVDDVAVIRFNTFTVKGAARFRNEECAYTALRGREVPVPEVIALDLSRTVAPYDFIIVSKLPGLPVVDAWADLSVAAREHVATAAGEYLATIHAQTFARFGALGSGEDRGFARWYDYVADYLDRYASFARELGVVSNNDCARLMAAIARHRPLLETVTHAALVHSDYHWENVLQQHGRVTGVIDFEWALAGDPAWDFIVQEKWEAVCPGSMRHVYSGYTHRRALPPDHARRVAIYQLLLHVETAVDEARRANVPGVAAARDAMFATLGELESG
jgi:aminoglycoside phosphotransferase (APT) family kinase protein